MKAFDGTSEWEILPHVTRIRRAWWMEMVRANPDVRIILLAHNNHLQKLQFSGELTAVPWDSISQRGRRGDYRAIAFTHLGPHRAGNAFPIARQSSILCCDHARRCNPVRIVWNSMSSMPVVRRIHSLTLTDDPMEAKRMRSQSASQKTNLSEGI